MKRRERAKRKELYEKKKKDHVDRVHRFQRIIEVRSEDANRFIPKIYTFIHFIVDKIN